MDISVSIKEVHQVAVEHGWWDTDRDPREVVALMHSELSEALEEARAGRPMVWYECPQAARQICDYLNTDCSYKNHERCYNLLRQSNKPEGIAVELIDCVIRIMDFMGRYDIEYLPKSLRLTYDTSEDGLPVLICKLHSMLSSLFSSGGLGEAAISIDDGGVRNTTMAGFVFSDVIDMIFKWLRTHGVTPETVLNEKAEYNKSRPYRHGKKF